VVMKAIPFFENVHKCLLCKAFFVYGTSSKVVTKRFSFKEEFLESYEEFCM
jgi:hypothetical protein